MDAIAERLTRVQSRIERAATRAGRDPATVHLLAVSKKHGTNAIRAAYDAGQRDFGENYVQEMTEKAELLRDLPQLRFHFIGHLQRNKAKQVARVASAVHTVDSVRLALELGRYAAQRAPLSPAHEHDAPRSRLSVFVQVNLAAEPQKSGCQPAELGAVLHAVEQSPSLTLAGLMTLPPLTEDPEQARRYFEMLEKLRNDHGGPPRLPDLSMGMSADLEPAIAAGATWVRIGTAIFGERPGGHGSR